MDAQQELFIALKLGLENKGYAVYDSILPPDGTPYPFIYLGQNWQNDEGNKSAIFGYVRQIVHVWHNDTMKRGTVSKMLSDIKEVARSIERTENFSWTIQNSSTEQQILPDNSTKPPLLHGYLSLRWHFS